MTQRIVKDSAGRTWTCDAPDGTRAAGDAARPMGLDVKLSCRTESVSQAVPVTVGWGWEKMADAGLARMITLASPVPKH